MSYNWPGNIRELENVIERAVLLEESSVIQASSLPPEFGIRNSEFGIRKSEDLAETEQILSLEEVEKQALAHALKVTGNNIQQAAKALGIDRVTVYRKLKKYNLPVT
jgi:transcriptional regulator of acetoin/glycerol metabolism